MNTSAQSLSNKTILISAGGTGGHVYPALAIAKELQALGAKVQWLGTQAGIESRLVPEAQIPLHTLFVQGLRGNGLKRLIKAPFTVFSAIWQAKTVVKKTQPDLFLGFGGFASGPGAVAAKLSGVPVIIHEQNAAMGITNKIVSYWATRVLLAFPIKGRKGLVTGNPIRQSISALPHPNERGNAQEKVRVLVIGGSLGSQAINKTVPKALEPLLNKITLTHQTGKTTYQDTLADYQQRNLTESINICEYIEDIDNVYAQTDLVIARAGALTVSEIASVGLPAIFIPLPHAVDNHQYLNAKFLETHKAAAIIEQSDLTAELLNQTVSELLDYNTRIDMANRAKNCSHENALPTIINQLTEVLYANDTH